MDDRIRRAIAGDTDSLGQLLFDYHDRLTQRIAGKLSPEMRAAIDPDDVVQQTFIEAFRDIGRFQADSDRAFYAWLEKIAQNRLLDMVRARKSKKRGGDRRQVDNRAAGQTSSIADLFDVLSAKLPTPSRNVARHEGVQALQVHLASLPEEYREVIRLRHLEGLSLEEVAVATGQTIPAVRGLLYRGKKKLRAAMGRSSLWLSKK